MTEQIRNTQSKDHKVRNGSLLLTGTLAIALGSAALGGAFSNKPANADGYPSSSPSMLGTPNPSEAGASPSNGPEASAAASLYNIVHHEAVDKSTIVFLPKNTVIVGDPMFVGGQLPNGQTPLEAYAKESYNPTDEANYIQGGRIIVDSDALTGTVVVLEEDAYVQTAPEYGFSYQTVETKEQAENLAKVKQIETKYLGCDNGCVGGVDIVHYPTDPRQGSTDNGSVTPMESPTAIYPTASGETLPNVNLGDMTFAQESAYILSLFKTGKVDPNSEEGILLTKYLNCICAQLACGGPSETPAPTPKPSQSGECVSTDIDHAYTGWNKNGFDRSKAPKENPSTEPLLGEVTRGIFQSDGAWKFDGKTAWNTSYDSKSSTAEIYVYEFSQPKKLDLSYDWGGDYQVVPPCLPENQFNDLSNPNSLLSKDITAALKSHSGGVKVTYVSADGSTKSVWHYN